MHIRLLAHASLVALLGSGAAGDTLCTAMRALAQQANTGFSAATPLPGADSCRTSVALSGETTYHCAWKFTFRATDASDTFSDMNARLRSCFDGTEAGEDDGVNHPDSYTQRRHDTDAATWRVSLKDKTARRETYVFVSVTQNGS